MHPVFRFRTKVVDPSGLPCGGLSIAVVEWDPIRDDLLAVGTTDGEGCFEVSFTRREFNQDPFEAERHPEIYVVLSVERDGRKVALYRSKPYRPLFSGGIAEVLPIVLPAPPAAMPAIEGCEPVPGLKEGVVRLDVDDALVHLAIDDVAPVVERITGVPGLGTGYRIVIADGFDDLLTTLGRNHGAEPDVVPSQLLGFVLDQELSSFYDPVDSVLTLNRLFLSRQSFEAMKVTLGHELVHVAQFRQFPDLVDRTREATKRLVQSLAAEGADLSGFGALLESSGLLQLLSEVEGYAAYVQKDFLEKEYPGAMFFSCFSPLGLAARGLTSIRVPLHAAAFRRGLEELGAGIHVCRARQQGEVPAVFEC